MCVCAILGWSTSFDVCMAGERIGDYGLWNVRFLDGVYPTCTDLMCLGHM
jgi:hypothetical protein